MGSNDECGHLQQGLRGLKCSLNRVRQILITDIVDTDADNVLTLVWQFNFMVNTSEHESIKVGKKLQMWTNHPPRH